MGHYSLLWFITKVMTNQKEFTLFPKYTEFKIRIFKYIWDVLDEMIKVEVLKMNYMKLYID